MRCQPLAANLLRHRLMAVLTMLFVVVSAARSNDLPTSVLNTLKRFDLGQEGLSIRIESIDSGDVVLDFRSDVAMNPASTMKLVTTYAALSTLSPGHQWQTGVYLLGEVDANGVLNGDLGLRGGGDPYLVEETLLQMLGELRRRGISEINGDIVFDKGLYQLPPSDPAAFDNEPLRAYNVAPDPLLVNFKVIRFWFEPAADGQNVKVTTQPALPNLTIVNDLKQRPGRCRGYQRGIRIDAEPNGREVRFSGEFPSGCKRYSMGRTLLDHDSYAFGLIKNQWQLLGGTITGTFRRDTVPEDAESLFDWRSRPFGEVIRLINKHSNNVMTRQVFLTLGQHYFGAPATIEKSRDAVVAWTEQQALALDDFFVDNGSGLSREARISTAAMTRLLQHAWRSPYMPEFVSSLSLVGTDGTFRRRHKRGALTGRAHLKTGRLDDVSALAGYMLAKDGQRYAISVIHNDKGVHRGAGEAVQDALLRWLYHYEPRPITVNDRASGTGAGESP
ncbi:MAG: D-alanyl-D-alanine carboxypeptidase/D-alanyl-D-alanine-endopeptidase [Pseudomonadota bacterium]